ncbi:sigma-E factor negative regulatory protein [Pseudomaricurvus sp.]|uniref:sigma-E factor negative regulatory protein n=1 Tax=Pseudomaricurvus sp. TaxID=2004510 RepID=UPI003F6B9972
MKVRIKSEMINMAEHLNHKQRAAGMPESVSALVDGEVSEMELHRVLKASETDEGVRDTWSRYQLISASLRNDTPSNPMIDLSAAIRESIDAEETHQPVAQPVSGSSWIRRVGQNVGKLGVAASVAAVMVVTSQMVDLSGNPGSQVAEVADNTSSAVKTSEDLLTPNPSLPAGFGGPSLGARTVSSHPQMPVQQAETHYYPVVKRAQGAYSDNPAPEVQAYLQRVMEVHAAHAALNSSRGMLPYARVPAEISE